MVERRRGGVWPPSERSFFPFLPLESSRAEPSLACAPSDPSERHEKSHTSREERTEKRKQERKERVIEMESSPSARAFAASFLCNSSVCCWSVVVAQQKIRESFRSAPKR